MTPIKVRRLALIGPLGSYVKAIRVSIYVPSNLLWDGHWDVAPLCPSEDVRQAPNRHRHRLSAADAGGVTRGNARLFEAPLCASPPPASIVLAQADVSFRPTSQMPVTWPYASSGRISPVDPAGVARRVRAPAWPRVGTAPALHRTEAVASFRAIVLRSPIP